MQIKEILTGQETRKVSVKGTLTSVAAPREVNLKVGGKAKVADAILSDASGQVALSLWGDQTATPEGSVIEISNGYTKVFKGKVTLNIGRYGKMRVVA